MAHFTTAAALKDVPRINGARVAVVLEHKFIPDEVAAYLSGFALLGAEVELVSRIWWGDFKPEKTLFYGDIDPNDNEPWQAPDTVNVSRDVSQTTPADYDAVIMAANYTSVRLRYVALKPFHELTPADINAFDYHAHVKQAPMVQFFADAMANKKVVKGLLCHGLWILTPNPRLLRGRKVICHTVVMADIVNCGAHITLTNDGVVVDEDLVTGFSRYETLPFIAAIARQVAARRP
ncbi:DJ-1/PfpI family protein [Teichococcus aerofrigidensis]